VASIYKIVNIYELSVEGPVVVKGSHVSASAFSSPSIPSIALYSFHYQPAAYHININVLFAFSASIG
jgi:hypothetical protein